MTTVKAYFNHISTLGTTKAKGDAYEDFCLGFLLRLPEYKAGWLLKDVPGAILTALDLNAIDNQGIDGIVYRHDNVLIPFQAKFRSDDYHLVATDVSNTLVTLLRMRAENRPFGHIIIMTNCRGISETTDAHKILDVEWIFQSRQLNKIGEQTVAVLTNTATAKPPFLKLRSHQIEDLNKLGQDYYDRTFRGVVQNALFFAVMGYGKSICIAEYCRMLQQYHPVTIFIPTLTLALVNQLYNDLINYYAGLARVIKFTKPVINIFASDGPIKTGFSPGIGSLPQIVITTYVSYDKLMALKKPHLVIFDEVHHFKGQIKPDVNYVGFTATPTPDIYTKFNKVVDRTLGWAIRGGHLTDYRINLFLFTGEGDPETTRLNLLSDMIFRIITQKHSKNLLVVCSKQTEAQEIALNLRKRSVTAHAIISGDSSVSRRAKERDVADNGGVITSVKIYREGVNLPWLEGVFICVGSMAQVTAGQILGRPLRKYPGKDMANIYFPVFPASLEESETGIPAGYTDVTNENFRPILEFMEFVALNDPDVFEGSDTQERLRHTKLSVLMHKTGGLRFHPDQADPSQSVLEDLSNKLAITVYNKLNGLVAVDFKHNWVNCVMATILRLSAEVFKASDIKTHAETLQNYLIAVGAIKTGAKTPAQTISRVLTEDLKKNLRVIDSIKIGEYFICDRPKMEMLVGTIPGDFPVVA